MSSTLFIAEVKKIIKKIEDTQMQPIHKVSRLVAEAIIEKKLVYIFGTGHSNILAIECFRRAGGLANIQPVFDIGLDFLSGARRQSGFERLPGYANCIIHDYDIQSGDVVIVVSNSGRNPAPVQFALASKQLGAVVVALVSKEHSDRVPSNDPSGKKLGEVADIVIDNGCPAGDALVSLPGMLPKVSPGSTVAGATIINEIVAQAAKLVLEKGHSPLVGFSGNLPEGREYNERISDQREKIYKQMRHR